jgi:hypothetical protein
VGILWIVIVGLIAGVIARFLLPGPNNPHGFLLTAVLASLARCRHLHRPRAAIPARHRFAQLKVHQIAHHQRTTVSAPPNWWPF